MDPVAPVILALAVILIAAKIGGALARRLGQPAVLGELAIGVVLGNLSHLGFHGFEPMGELPAIDTLSRLGVVILLFEIGLGSTVREMLQVGWSAFLVATLGVVAPFTLGWAVSAWLLPEHSIYLHMFAGATLCATSVGITGRVFTDLGKSASTEARVILGAAVIDDVMGLVILSAVTGLIVAADRGMPFGVGTIAMPLVKAVVFLGAALSLGVVVSPWLFALASRLRVRGTLIATALACCFLLAWLASWIGLAAIVGAFAAGLVLDKSHTRAFVEHGEHPLDELVAPISAFLVPVFFVLMGMHTDLAAFAVPGAASLAAALTAAAIVGKQVCSLGVLERGVDRLSVGIGMIPRGEVGLIFANIGLSLYVGGERIVDPASYSAVVVMVMVTTLLTPPALRWSLGRHSRR